MKNAAPDACMHVSGAGDFFEPELAKIPMAPTGGTLGEFRYIKSYSPPSRNLIAWPIALRMPSSTVKR